jgi:hypothetical protein
MAAEKAAYAEKHEAYLASLSPANRERYEKGLPGLLESALVRFIHHVEHPVEYEALSEYRGEILRLAYGVSFQVGGHWVRVPYSNIKFEVEL